MKPVIALLSTLIKEALVVVVILWVLPLLGIRLPLGVTIGILIVVAAWAVFTYRPIKRVMEKEAFSPTEEMLGRKGTALTKLAPKGLVRIGGETWEAFSSNADIAAGDKVTVLRIDGLKLTVQKEE
ncbi:NfeD family protein [Chloroflexota bacterium]